MLVGNRGFPVGTIRSSTLASTNRFDYGTPRSIKSFRSSTEDSVVKLFCWRELQFYEKLLKHIAVQRILDAKIRTYVCQSSLMTARDDDHQSYSLGPGIRHVLCRRLSKILRQNFSHFHRRGRRSDRYYLNGVGRNTKYFHTESRIDYANILHKILLSGTYSWSLVIWNRSVFDLCAGYGKLVFLISSKKVTWQRRLYWFYYTHTSSIFLFASCRKTN